MKRPAWLVALLMVAVSMAWPVMGQEKVDPASPNQPDNNRVQGDLQVTFGRMLSADLKLGPFYFRPQVGFSNRWRSTLQRNEKQQIDPFKGEIVTSGIGRVDVVLPLNRHTLRAGYQAIYNYYWTTAARRAWDQIINAGYSFDGGRWRFDATHETSLVNQDALDLLLDGTVGDGNLDVSVLTHTKRSNTQAGWRLDLGPRPYLLVGGNYDTYRYDQQDKDSGEQLAVALNRTQYGVLGELGYETARSTFRVRYRELWVDYEDQESFRDNRSRSVEGEIELAPTARLNGVLTGGYKWIIPVQEGVTAFRGTVARGTLAYVLSDRVGVTVGGRRETFPTAWQNNLYFIDTLGRAGLLFKVSRRLAVGPDYQVRRLFYPVEATFPQFDGTLFTGKRSDTERTYAGSFLWRLGSQTIDLRGGWYKRVSNFDVGEISGLVVNIGYRAAF